jgi:FAD/FMN-containing dehydrogenase
MSLLPRPLRSTQAQFLEAARDLLGSAGVVDAVPRPKPRSTEDAAARVPLCIQRPASTDQVAAAVRLCEQYRYTVVSPDSGCELGGPANQGTDNGQVLLSVERMDRIETFDHMNRSIQVEAGVRASQLRKFLAGHGLWMPFDVGGDPSVGGMIESNAGGSRFLRYGSMRCAVLGLEVVLSDGSVFDAMQDARRQTIAIDPKQVFIGAGGALGIVTRATLEAQLMQHVRATFLLVPQQGYPGLSDVLLRVEKLYGDSLTALESLSGESIRLALREFPELQAPFAPDRVPDHVALIEIASSSRSSAEQLRQNFGETLEMLKRQRVLSEVYSDDRGEFWTLRTAIGDVVKSQPTMLAFDTSFSRSRLVAFRQALMSLVQERYAGVVAADYGHFADGSLHIRLIVPEGVKPDFPPARLRRMHDDIVDLVVNRHAGTITADESTGALSGMGAARADASLLGRFANELKALITIGRKPGVSSNPQDKP